MYLRCTILNGVTTDDWNEEIGNEKRKRETEMRNGEIRCTLHVAATCSCYVFMLSYLAYNAAYYSSLFHDHSVRPGSSPRL